MIILAIDSTAVTATVALLEDDTVIGVSSVHNKLTHSEKLLPMIDELLINAGYTIDDVELIAVSRGPGSFTGVRIGIATAKGLSFARNIQICAISALEALAENFRMLTNERMNEFIICPSMDARRNELYNATFIYDGVDIKRLTEDRAISCEELINELLDTDLPIFINGDGANVLSTYLKNNSFNHKFYLAPELLLKQNAISVGKLGYKKFLLNEITDAKTLTPLYLRTSQAERINNKEN